MSRAALGLRAKTARAIAVVVAEGEDGPEVLLRSEVPSFDPKRPASRQPHHAGLELDPARARRVVAAAEAAVRDATREALTELLQDARRAGRLVAAGVAGSPVSDPTRIGNPHMRAHAAEGQLFRAAWEQALQARKLPWLRLSDRDAWDEAAQTLRCDAAALRRQIAGLGRELGPPWRADEKLAALAAWVALGTLA